MDDLLLLLFLLFTTLAIFFIGYFIGKQEGIFQGRIDQTTATFRHLRNLIGDENVAQ